MHLLPSLFSLLAKFSSHVAVGLGPISLLSVRSYSHLLDAAYILCGYILWVVIVLLLQWVKSLCFNLSDLLFFTVAPWF